jgi:hypothetical protein
MPLLTLRRGAGWRRRRSTAPAVACLVGALAACGLAFTAAAQPPPGAPTPPPPGAPAPPPGAVPGSPPAEGVVGEAPIAAGNLAAARERALNEAFRQLVEAAFAGLLQESGQAGAATPALASLRASWIARPKRLVRSYRVLEQAEQAGVYRVRIAAELDDTYMRREFDRARGGGANRGVAPGMLPVVASGAPEAAVAVVAALNGQGLRAQLQVGGGTDEAALRAVAARAGRGLVVLVTGRAAGEGPVRGTGQQSVDCQLGVRLIPVEGAAAGEKAAGGRGFHTSEEEARTACFARATADLVPALLPDLGGGGAAGPGADRVITLDLDINEPAVISPVLRALRKLAGPSSTEVRRVVVGRVEARVSSRLPPAALLAALGRELQALATVTRTGPERPDRLQAQVRLLPQTPPAAPATVAPPAALQRP